VTQCFVFLRIKLSENIHILNLDGAVVLLVPDFLQSSCPFFY